MSEIHECLTVLCPFDHVPQAAADLTVERRADLALEGITGNFRRIDLHGAYKPPLGATIA